MLQVLLQIDHLVFLWVTITISKVLTKAIREWEGDLRNIVITTLIIFDFEFILN